jgi:YD repeat-containing protein
VRPRLGGWGLYDYHFEYKDFVTELTDSLGHKTILQYDANNLPVRETDELGNVAKY